MTKNLDEDDPVPRPPGPKLTKAGKPKRSGGRREGAGKPKIGITPEGWKKIQEIAEDFGTGMEAAAALGISVSTLEVRLKEYNLTWTEFSTPFKATGMMKLRRAQMKTAIGNGKTPGNPTMQIWLGKQLLDQKDKSEVGFDKDRPVKFVLNMGKQIEKDEDNGEEKRGDGEKA